jgi:putative peptidoglycan lipid II flippase
VIKKLLTKKLTTITSAAFIVGAFSFLSRFIGFIRDRILAGIFGAGQDLDVYFAAFRIPDLLFQMIVVGALSASFIPLLTKYMKKSAKKTWLFVSKSLNLLILIFAVFAAIVSLFAPQLAELIAPGFSPEAKQQVAELMRILFISQVMLAVSMIFGSVLQAMRRFIVYSIAPIFYNAGIIFGAIFLTDQHGIHGVVYGVLIGAGLHALSQFIAVWSLGYSYKPSFRFKDPGIIYLLKHALPRTLGLATAQLNVIIMSVIASLAGVGSVTIFTFAHNINFFPVGIIGVSYAVAAFPSLCDAAESRRSEFRAAISTTLRQILLFLVPATMLFLLLRTQIVRIVVGAGEFDWTATTQTFELLGLFALSFVAQGMNYTLIRGLFAYHDTASPLWISFTSVLVNGLLAYTLLPQFGVLALGISFSVSTYLQFFLLAAVLRSKSGGLDEKRIFVSSMVFIVAAVIAGVMVQMTKYLYGTFIPLESFFAVLGQFLAASTVGGIFYLLSGYLMRSEEIDAFFTGVKRRFLKKSTPQEAIDSV